MPSVKNSLKILISSSLIVMIVLITIIFSWIGEFGDKINLLEHEIQLTNAKNIELLSFEEGGRMYLSDLKNIHLLNSDGQSFSSFIQKLKDNRNISISKKILNINKTFSFSIKNLNSCKDIYCFRFVLPFKNLGQNIWKSLMGIEDIRFLFHNGIDFKSLLRAFLTDLKAMSYKQGGSTLTQQFVKNFFLKSEKSIKRKLKELVWSIYLEHKYSKRAIISFYLNYVYWGSSQGIRLQGITAASLFYFNKPSNELTEYESVILVSMLKGPYYYRPTKHLARLKMRVNILLKKLIENNIYSSQTPVWSDQKWLSWQRTIIESNKSNSLRYLILNMNNLNNQNDFVDRYILTNSAERILKRVRKQTKEDIFSYKILIGNITKGSFIKQYSRFERNLSSAITIEKHSIGSILKPLIYSILVKSFNVKMNEQIRTDPIRLKLKSGNWVPREAHNHLPDVISLAYALKHSLNRPIIKLVKRVGFDLFEKELIQYLPNLKTPLKEYPAQLLGSIELSLKEIFKIYKNLVTACPVDSSIQEVLSLLNNPNKTTIASRVGKILGNYNFFGKTGTSNGGLNNWFVFSQGNLLGVIWFGREEKGIKDHYPLYGSNTSFLIYKNFILNRAKPISEFNCLVNKRSD